MIRMHPTNSKDPFLVHPLPVVAFLPSVELALRNAKVKYDRNEIVERLMKGKPRVAVLMGAPEHPACLHDAAIAKLVVSTLWSKGAIPFVMTVPSINQMAAMGHGGMHFDLATRNTTTAMVVAHIEAHGYDAAIAIASGEFVPVAELAAFVEVDIYRRNCKRPPFYAFFIPPPLAGDRALPKAIKDVLRTVRKKLEHKGLRRELDFLMSARLRPNTYPMFYKFLEHLVARKLLTRGKRDELLLAIAAAISEKPGPPPFMENTNTNRIVLHGLGLVPQGMDLLVKPPDEAELARAIGAFPGHYDKNPHELVIDQSIKESVLLQFGIKFEII